MEKMPKDSKTPETEPKFDYEIFERGNDIVIQGGFLNVGEVEDISLDASPDGTTLYIRVFKDEISAEEKMITKIKLPLPIWAEEADVEVKNNQIQIVLPKRNSV